MGLAVAGCGVETHGIGEGCVEDAVVGGGDVLEDGGEAVALGCGEGFDARHVLYGKDEEFEGPDGPEGYECDPGVVFSDDAIALGAFELEIGGEELLVVGGAIVELGGEFEGGLVGDVLGGPDLAVGMGVAGAHHGTAVFEDLHVLDFGAGAEFGGLFGPHLDDAADGGEIHGGEGEVVAGVEAEDTAEAALGFSAQQAGVIDIQGGVEDIGFEGGEVVFEDVGAGVGGGVVAACAGVSGAEVAGGVVGDGWRCCGVFGLALPGALRAMRGDDDPLALERVPAAVRGFEEGGFHQARSSAAGMLRRHAPSTASQM